MRLRKLLDVFCAIAVAYAAPQDVVPLYPVTNITTPAPGPSAPCDAKCSVYYPQISAISWVPGSDISYTTKLTVGTVSEIIYTSEGATLYTSTETIWAYVPPEYDLYRQYTDEAGTVLVDVPLTISNNVVFSQLTYPTPFVDYLTEYYWEGALPTHDKVSASACATATLEPSVAMLSQHPPYPQPTEFNVDEDDPWGQEHQPIWVALDAEPNKSFFDASFPSESAFLYCTSVAQAKPTPTRYSIPKFVLDHTTIYRSPRSERIIHTESTATGWEETEEPVPPTGGPDKTALIPHTESTEDGFEETTIPVSQTTKAPQVIRSETPAIHWEVSASGFEQQPQAEQTRQPPGTVQATADDFAVPTPIFTYLPTVFNGQPTNIPAFILPGSSATATIGQTVTFDGQPTVLAIPEIYFTTVSTILNGETTTIPVYILNKSRTATLGQTVTLDDTTTVLSSPTSPRLDQKPGDAKATSDVRAPTSTGSGDFEGAAGHGLVISSAASLGVLLGIVVIWL